MKKGQLGTYGNEIGTFMYRRHCPHKGLTLESTSAASKVAKAA